jgi:hypothetical protein
LSSPKVLIENDFKILTVAEDDVDAAAASLGVTGAKVASPAAAPDATPSTASPRCSATSAWRKNTPNRTTPPPAAKCLKSWLGAAPGRSDPYQGVTMVPFVRFVGRLWCSVAARTGRTDLT